MNWFKRTWRAFVKAANEPMTQHQFDSGLAMAGIKIERCPHGGKSMKPDGQANTGPR